MAESNLQHTIKAFVRRGEEQYVAECVEIAVVTQGRTLEETLGNLREAVALHLEGEDLADLGFAPNPTILVTMELELVPNAA
jgi:predicted RNase H-like HicB family nuclease